MELSDKNQEVISKFMKLEHVDEFSSPLLVTTNPCYLEGIKKAPVKILYIGQEVNTWGNSLKHLRLDAKQLEEIYYQFFCLNYATNKDFWKAARSFIEVEKQDLSKYIIWNNALIAGRKDAKGAPAHAQELMNISVDYLTYLINYFEPDLIVTVVGPKDPYYQVLSQLFKNCNIKITGYPTSKNPLIISEDNRLYWTYHPNYLNRIASKKEILETIKKAVLSLKNRNNKETSYQKHL